MPDLSKVQQYVELKRALTQHARACYSMLDSTIVEDRRMVIVNKMNELEKELDSTCQNWRDWLRFFSPHSL